MFDSDLPASARFTLHWSVVVETRAQFPVPSGYRLVAVWSSPVNPDACFEAAGFTDFGDQDAVWEGYANEVLERLLTALQSSRVESCAHPPKTTVESIAKRRMCAAYPPLRSKNEVSLI